MADIVERLRIPSDTEEVMKAWDYLRSYLLEGKKGSYARDIFEALLSHIDEEREEAAGEIERLRKALEKVCTAIEREPVCGGDLDYPHGHNDWLGWRKKIMRPAAEFARAALYQDKGGE